MLNFFYRALKNKKGFTLIEVLVVVAIIGILVALAAPRVIRRIDDSRLASDEATAKVLNDAILGLELDADKLDDYDADWHTGKINWGDLKEFLDDPTVITNHPDDDVEVQNIGSLTGKSRKHDIVPAGPGTEDNASEVWKFIVRAKDGATN